MAVSVVARSPDRATGMTLLWHGLQTVPRGSTGGLLLLLGQMETSGKSGTVRRPCHNSDSLAIGWTQRQRGEGSGLAVLQIPLDREPHLVVRPVAIGVEAQADGFLPGLV